MAYEQRDMNGSLFKNNKREKDTHPNAQGTAMIDGVEYYVSAWTKKDKNGNPWQSLAFKRKDANSGSTRERGASTQKPNQPIVEDGEDDIPF